MTFEAANFTTPIDMVTYASSVTGGWFWNLILVAIWVIVFGTLSGYTTTERAFATTSFFTGMLAGLLFVMGGIDVLPAVISVALAIASFIMLLFSKA